MEEKNCVSGRCDVTENVLVSHLDAEKEKAFVFDKSRLKEIKIKIFGKDNCDKCKLIREMFSNYSGVYYSLDTVDGLTEASIFNAFDVPTIVVEKNGKEIVRWKDIPDKEELKSVFDNL